MFDPETTKIIQSAAPLEGLDLQRLPQDLTDAYALVVAARLGTVDMADGQVPPEWQDTILQLRRLADTYEGLTIFLPRDDVQRPACAFVAGSAHFTLDQARRVQARLSGEEVARPSVSSFGVGTEVSAALLFLVGGHQADAAETVKVFTPSHTNPVADQLIAFIAALASGSGKELRKIVYEPLADAHRPEVDYLDAAADMMWHELAKAVQLVACFALGLGGDPHSPLAILSGVIERLSQLSQPIGLNDSNIQICLPLAGPYHLARLLRAVGETLLASTVTSTRPPGGITASEWSNFTRDFASQRPFLWRNHIKAIEEGFLNAGSSFVLTFPTGAGKTSVTELRIASELMRGRSVIYLAPTRALVDQVATEISRTVRPIAEEVVRGRFLEDFGEKAGARVFVQTPEQCLAFLSHEPEGHRDLGLIVVDECHQLAGELPKTGSPTKQPGRRAVDAMWALLSLLQRSPGADIVLISAMVRNGAELARWLEVATGRPARLLDLAWKPTRQVRGVVAYEEADISSLQTELRTRQVARWPNRNPREKDKKGLMATPVGLFCHTQVWNTNSTFAKFPLLSDHVQLGVGGYWSLTANRNQVAGKLLEAMARAGMRPIVFTQQISYTTIIADHGAVGLQGAGVAPIELNQIEQNLFEAASLELGNPSLVERPSHQRVGVHHGLLLLSERLAMESAFRRSDGLFALVATPTVAQGINLPAEAVIIAGDDRWTEDAEEGGPETLAVHELLNAAGRAGRAGHYAHGIVIDLPGKVFSVQQNEGKITFSGLDHVLGLFGLPDQCLDVVDPVTQITDLIAISGTSADVGQYLVRRVGGLDSGVLRSMLSASLGNALHAERVFRAETQAALLRARIAALDEQVETENLEMEEWRELAGQTGISPLVVATVASHLPNMESISAWSFAELLGFYSKLIVDCSGMLFGLVDPSSSDLNRIIPRRRGKGEKKDEYTEDVPTWEKRWQDALREAMPLWLSGSPIISFGEALHRHRGAKGNVKAVHLGRRFALQAAGGLSYAASLVARVIEHRYKEHAPETLLAWLKLVVGCVREGFDDPDKLLVFWYLRRHSGLYPRVRVHQIYNEKVNGLIPAWQDLPGIEARRTVIRNLLGEEAP